MPAWIVEALGMAGVAFGAYAAIRADLAAMRVRVEEAHRRIDELVK